MLTLIRLFRIYVIRYEDVLKHRFYDMCIKVGISLCYVFNSMYDFCLVFKMSNLGGTLILSKLSRVVLFAIKFYKRMTKYMPHRCRFVPSCSSYAMDAVSRYGAIRGLGLFLKRFLRCNFFCKGGIDKVP